MLCVISLVKYAKRISFAFVFVICSGAGSMSSVVMRENDDSLFSLLECCSAK